MSRNLQGITFGFFEDLPTDDKNYLDDILYGSKAYSVKIKLPWDEEAQEKPSSVVETTEPPPTSTQPSVIPNVLKDPNASLPGELATGAGDVLQLPPAAVAPPGLHQPVYSIPMPVPPNMISVVGVYQQPNVPISCMHLITPQGVILAHPAMPPQDQLLATTEKLPTSADEEQYSDGKPQEKEAMKILAGKTYERRNKKKRPPNYYENLERKQGPECPALTQELCAQPPPHPPPPQPPTVYTSSISHVPVNAPTAPMSTTAVCPAVVNVQYPPPVATSQQLRAGQMPSGDQVAAMHDVILQQASHSVHYEAPILAKPTPPAADVGGENEHACAEPVPQIMEEKSAKPAVPDLQGNEMAHGENTSLSSEIYTDGRRTDDGQPMANNNLQPLDPVHKEEAALTDGADRFSAESAERMEITFGSVSMPDIAMDRVPVDKNLPTTSDHTAGTLAPECQNTAPAVTPTVVSGQAPTPNAGNVSQVESGAHQAVIASTTETAAGAPNPSSSPSSGGEQKSPSVTPANSSTTQPASKPKSWAGLFQSSDTSPSSVIYNSTPSLASDGMQTKKQLTKLPDTVSPDKDVAIEKLGAFLNSYHLCYKPPALQPRGLINKGNWCYVNATLQALVACAPFCNLMRSLPAHPLLQRGPTSTPVLDSIVEFINEFSAMPVIKPPEKNNKGKGNIKHDLPTGPTFEPTYVYKMLQVIKHDGFKGGKQEDAEEFLSCLLNGLHDEMVAAMKIENAKKPNDVIANVTSNGKAESVKDDMSEDEYVDDAGWEQVGPKNKSVVTRSASFDKSPISEIFRGQIRNILNRPGLKESATLQPFFTLQLEIQPTGVHTVQEALNNLVSKEQLQDFTCSKTKMEVDASRRTLLEELPAILLLHLKCFVYDKNGGCQKVVKQLDFSAMLDIHKDLLSTAARSHYPPTQRRYKLFAVVKHIGVRAAGGHYVADIYHQSLGEWVHYDDNNVYVVTLPQVFKFRHPRVPYLLYYRRADLS